MSKHKTLNVSPETRLAVRRLAAKHELEMTEIVDCVFLENSITDNIISKFVKVRNKNREKK